MAELAGMVLTATLVLVWLDTPEDVVQQVSQYAQSQWQLSNGLQQ